MRSEGLETRSAYVPSEWAITPLQVEELWSPLGCGGNREPGEPVGMAGGRGWGLMKSGTCSHLMPLL